MNLPTHIHADYGRCFLIEEPQGTEVRIKLESDGREMLAYTGMLTVINYGLPQKPGWTPPTQIRNGVPVTPNSPPSGTRATGGDGSVQMTGQLRSTVGLPKAAADGVVDMKINATCNTEGLQKVSAQLCAMQMDALPRWKQWVRKLFPYKPIKLPNCEDGFIHGITNVVKVDVDWKDRIRILFGGVPEIRVNTTHREDARLGIVRTTTAFNVLPPWERMKPEQRDPEWPRV